MSRRRLIEGKESTLKGTMPDGTIRFVKYRAIKIPHCGHLTEVKVSILEEFEKLKRAYVVDCRECKALRRIYPGSMICSNCQQKEVQREVPLSSNRWVCPLCEATYMIDDYPLSNTEPTHPHERQN